MITLASNRNAAASDRSAMPTIRPNGFVPDRQPGRSRWRLLRQRNSRSVDISSRLPLCRELGNSWRIRTGDNVSEFCMPGGNFFEEDLGQIIWIPLGWLPMFPCPKASRDCDGCASQSDRARREFAASRLRNLAMTSDSLHQHDHRLRTALPVFRNLQIFRGLCPILK
jgi:hypothetical protein